MNNPPAFPLHNHGVQTLGLHFTGMTLRDYMAAKAMQAFLMNPSLINCPDEKVAHDAYNTADAMLKAREQ